ncbi:unnamed protein product [Urochloa humidicola]
MVGMSSTAAAWRQQLPPVPDPTHFHIDRVRSLTNEKVLLETGAYMDKGDVRSRKAPAGQMVRWFHSARSCTVTKP